MGFRIRFSDRVRVAGRLFCLLAVSCAGAEVAAQTDVSGTITENTTWTLAGSPYLANSIVVSSGATLTVEPGVVVKMISGSLVQVEAGGSLVAEGTAAEPVVVTSRFDDAAGGDTDGGSDAAPTPGEWGGIVFQPGSAGRLSHAVVRYGGGRNGNGHALVHVRGDAAVEIADAELSHSASTGVRVDGEAGMVSTFTMTASTVGETLYGVIYGGDFSGGQQGSLTGNAFSSALFPVLIYNTLPLLLDNVATVGTEGRPGCYTLSSLRLTVAGTLRGDAGMPFCIDGFIAVSSGATLTVEPGVVVKMISGSLVQVEAGGSLVAEGTAAEPVVVTSRFDDAAGGDTDGGSDAAPTPGEWGGIVFQPGSAGRLSHAVVRYGGGRNGNGHALVHVRGDAAVEIADAELSHSASTGVRVDDSASEFSIVRTNIFDSPYGLYNVSSTRLPASNNWWGDGSGPYVPDPNPNDDVDEGNPNGQGVQILGNVTYSPWASSPFAIIPPAPDLVVTDLRLSPETAGPGEILQVRFSVLNQGDASAQPSTANVRLNQSPDGVTTDDLLLDQIQVPAIEPGTLSDVSVDVTLPADLASGPHYVWVTADVNSTAGQRPADEANDQASVRLAVPSFGTTVIAHGLAFPPVVGRDEGLTEDQSWTLSTAQAILARVGKGRIFVIRGDGGGTSGMEIIPFTSGGEGKGQGEQIIVFDWLQESPYSHFGLLEGAASALSALLVQGAVEGKWDLDQVHLIGHSRGTVVMSEVAQRLGAFAATPELLPEGMVIDPSLHLTTLDAHPWDRDLDDGPGGADDRSVNGDFDLDGNGLRDGVVCWSNVGYADNYWQDGSDLRVGRPLNLEGLPALPGCNYSVDLSATYPDALEIDHGGVHTYYYGTIDHADGAVEDEDPVDDSWYRIPDQPGSTVRTIRGYNRARALGGDGIGAIATAGTRPSPLSDETLRLGQLHNGSFDLNPTGIRNALRRSFIPGWDYQGGGGGSLENADGAIWLQLQPVDPTATSNWTLVPRNATDLTFDYRSLILLGNGTVAVELIDREQGAVSIGSLSLNARSYGFQKMQIPSGRRGRAQKVRFTLQSGAVSIVDVLVRNVGFETARFVSASIDVAGSTAPRLSNSPLASSSGLPTLHAYDSQGRHTGVLTDSTSVAEIPRSRVVFYTDSLGVSHQRLVMPPADGAPYRIEVRTPGEGAPSAVDVYLEASLPGQPLRLAAYEGVSLSASGTITTTAGDLSVAPDLDIDDGDGSPGRQVPATRTLANRTVTTTVDGPGRVTPGTQIGVLDGDEVTLTFVPDEGAQVQDVVVDGASVGAVPSYTFSSLSRDHEVAASFAVATAGEDDLDLPGVATLENVYPNPASHTARVRFGLPTAQAVRVDLFDTAGRQVATLDQGFRSAGWHTVEVDAGALASGVYLVRLQAGSATSVQRVAITR